MTAFKLAAVYPIIETARIFQINKTEEIQQEFHDEYLLLIFKKIILKMNKMASKAIITGVIINATAFVGGSYLAKYLSGDQNRVEEKKRQDLAVENYQAAYEKHQEIEQNSLIGLQLMTKSRSR